MTAIETGSAVGSAVVGHGVLAGTAMNQKSHLRSSSNPTKNSDVAAVPARSKVRTSRQSRSCLEARSCTRGLALSLVR